MPVSTKDVIQYERQAIFLYSFWFVMYLVLGLGAIVLPGLAAMGVTFGFANDPKYLAGSGGLCAAAYGFIKPNEYAASFDRAISELQILRAKFDLLTDKQRADQLEACLRITTFKYQGTLPTEQKSPNPQ